MTHINLELYRVFCITARLGSISAAAKELYMTQPAVSQSIKTLENKLGGVLFLRTKKGVSLTGEGEIFYKYIEQGYSLMQTAERKFLEMQNLQSGQIKVGVSDTICKHYLIPYLEQYHNAYPKIKINVMNQKTLEIIDLLKAGTVDFGLINLPINSDETIIQRKLLQIQDCFVVGEKFKHLSLAPIPLEELAKYPILLLEESSSSRKFINGYFNQNNVAINPEIEISNIDLLIQFAKIGLGISCVVKDFIKEEIANNSLYEITLTEEIPKRAIGLATLRGVPLSSTVNKFIELLEG